MTISNYYQYFVSATGRRNIKSLPMSVLVLSFSSQRTFSCCSRLSEFDKFIIYIRHKLYEIVQHIIRGSSVKISAHFIKGADLFFVSLDDNVKKASSSSSHGFHFYAPPLASSNIGPRPTKRSKQKIIFERYIGSRS